MDTADVDTDVTVKAELKTEESSGEPNDSKYRSFPAAHRGFNFNNVVGSFKPKKEAFAAPSIKAPSLPRKEAAKASCPLQKSFVDQAAELLTRLFRAAMDKIVHYSKQLIRLYKENTHSWFVVCASQTGTEQSCSLDQ